MSLILWQTIFWAALLPCSLNPYKFVKKQPEIPYVLWSESWFWTLILFLTNIATKFRIFDVKLPKLLKLTMEFFQTPRLTTNQNINYALSKKDTLLKIKTNYFRQIHFMLNFTVFWSLNMV